MKLGFSAIVALFVLAVPAIAQQDLPLVFIDTPELIEGMQGTFADAIFGFLDKYKEQFTDALKEAIGKKQTPVIIASDEATAQWKIDSVIEEIHDSYGAYLEKQRKGEKPRPNEFVYTIEVWDVETNETIFAWNFRTKAGPYGGGFETAAADFAVKFKKFLEPAPTKKK